MTITATPTCPSWCASTHAPADDPTDIDYCESAPVFLQHTDGTVEIQVCDIATDVPLLDLNGRLFNLAQLQRLRRELDLAEQMMRAVLR